MKRIGFFFIALFAACLTATVFVSCGDDDEDNVLIGTWWGIHDSGYYTDFVFRSNGTGNMHQQEGDAGGDFAFKYKITQLNGQSGTVHMEISGKGNYDWDFRIENGKYLKLHGYELFKQ